jgi:hypothetical protein
MINFHPEFEKKGTTEPLTIEEEKELLIQQTKEGITTLITLKKQLEETGDKSPKTLDMLKEIEAELEIYRQYMEYFKKME